MKISILVIDDEKNITELVAALLEFQGFDVKGSNDPKKALFLLQETSFQGIIVDLMMPGMDGFDVIKEIRAKEQYSITPLFALSFKKLTDEERKFLYLNHVHFVQKPFEPLTLAETLKRHLQA